MKKEVIVSVRGIQFEIEPAEPVELITTGEHYLKNGKHYILYDEAELGGGLTKNRLKISGDRMELVKSGTTNAQMIFEAGKKHLTYYDTVVGSLFMGLSTDSLKVMDEEARLSVDILYSLEINYNHISNCKIRVDVREKPGEGE